ncbi:hypothetical protein [Herbaspirillum robiniae]|uniref:Uncharacterized protein n=1 Tax=Herbaspirillum robiniae TaxID=2014887 RepID=A0ABX2M7Z3_9BURK|nr:hypothetical protein [Herbaspirillum robiniae]NUU03896.1 hypothetical protein [Herbaspirillum robiniae]
MGKTLKIGSLCIVCATVLVLTSCAAGLVPKVDDPARKLQIAQDLFENRDRPLAAEPLIIDAISLYKEKHDVAGLVEGQRIYGLFLRSEAVGRSRQHYVEYGFKDKDVSFATRLSGALLYFERATALAKDNMLVDIIPNLYLNIALTNQAQGNGRATCAAFDESLRADDVRIQRSPQKKTILPREYASFREGVNDLKAKAGCAS